MNKKLDFSEILAVCIEKITAQSEDIETVLSQYPQMAGELRPLLEATL